MNCRPACGACCTAPSISSPIPGQVAQGGLFKPAGVPCIQLDATQRCKLFGQPTRPAVCVSLRPSPDMCGESRSHAMAWLGQLEQDTLPQP